ncbi:2,3-dihydroxy-2,3-dihydro-p-cumate dehydrogenase [Mycobacterium gordonae]|uniref:3-oxoacyl-[acyl-carrier-protein] reductase MabA n=1 Tax=Mycobacterium gordonae TaxID=1778 RepID=A0A0Q2RAK7_MYCGO|nr:MULTISPECIES: SDR family oxidoreductase [Mycobacterium]KQH81022.1 2,3-dihydroxy-2,3-dihydro-p-cumate dehydrogenase [Mycobacterium gordonae]MDP7731222.1 SDR family oxidoreductase [Mycobacterium sp. TY813]
MSGALTGRNAIVTGAASGIGLGIVTRLIADGAMVFAGTRNKDDLEWVYEHAAIAGGFVGELQQPGAADELVATAVEALGHVDVLVNNAGGGVILPTLEHTEESLRATVDNNLWTTIYCVRAVLPHMVSRGHGRIVNIGADSVRTGLVDHAMYNAAKGGVHAMITGLAREFAGAGITGNTVAPCYVRTPELTELLESGLAPPRLQRVVEEGTAIVPLGRPGDPAEVATAVAFLAGEDSRFITGQTIYVNGGSSMG